MPVLIPELALLLVIAYTDYKNREVSLYYYLGIIGAGLCSNYYSQGKTIHLMDTAINAGCLLVLFGISYLYIKLRYGSQTRFVNGYIGSGDLVFSIYLTLRFDILHFVFFYIGSLINALIITWVFSGKNKQHQSIPLAGIQALCMFVLIVVYSVFGIDFFFDERTLFKF